MAGSAIVECLQRCPSDEFSKKVTPGAVGPGFIAIHSGSKNPLFITSGKQSFIFNGPKMAYYQMHLLAARFVCRF